MTPGSTRKKPVCQKCGHLMAGHKRPHGVPVCPRNGSAPSSPQPPACETFPAPFEFNPSASGYWHRKNPNWVEPASHAKQTRFYDNIPERGSSWISTERDGGSQGTPSRQQPFKSPPPVHEVIDVDAEDEIEEAGHGCSASQRGDHQEYEQEFYEHEEPAEDDDSDTSSNGSSATILKRVTRRLSSVIGRSTPLASLYTSPREHVTTIRSAAQAEGLYTRIVHVNRESSVGFKDEPATPVRTFANREHSWMIALGRHQGAVNALVESAATPPRPAMRYQQEDMFEPYDYDRGLSRERNERVGSYPEDPRWIRNTFFNILAVGGIGVLVVGGIGAIGAIGGLVVFYCLSSI